MQGWRKICCGREQRLEGTQREARMRAVQWLEGGDLCKQPCGHLCSQQKHIYKMMNFASILFFFSQT